MLQFFLMTKRRVNHCLTIFTLAWLLLPLLGFGQNINRSNKRGPMGTQVNTYSGNLFVPRSDFFISSRGFDLRADFFYNSYSYAENVGFGNGWRFFYHIRYRHDTAGAKTIIWGDGREDRYTATGGAYQAPTGHFAKLTEYQQGKLMLAEPDGTTFWFDNASHKRVTKISEPNGNFLDFHYTDTLLASISTSSGQTFSLQYAGGKLAKLVDANTAILRYCSFLYDAAGNLAEVRDPLGGTMKYSYLVNGPLKTMEDKNRNVLNIVYYNDFSVSELVGCNKRISFSYDTASLTTYVTDHIEGGNNQVTRYEYKQQSGHQWLAAIAGNCCGFDLQFEFDAQGNKIKETDANGNTTRYTYDDRGNILTVTDAAGAVMKFTYSGEYNQITSFTDKKGFLSTLHYDSKGNLIRLVDAGNREYKASYGPNGDLLTSTNPAGQVFTYAYDAHGNPTTVSGPAGHYAAMIYDARGNLLTHTNARGQQRKMGYDILDRLTEITNPPNYTIRLDYDAESNPVALTNSNNEKVKLDYDASNRVVGHTDLAGNKTHLRYTETDKLKTVTDALGHTTRFTYDTRGRLTGIVDVLGNTINASYDAKRNLRSLSLPGGAIIRYVYDELDRLRSVSDEEGTLLELSHDNNGNVVAQTNGAGTKRTAEFDSLNRVTKLIDAEGHAIVVRYGIHGRVASVTDKAGNSRAYTYDEAGRVKTYTDEGGGVTVLTYDVAGNVVSLKDQNSNETAYTYDPLNRVTRSAFPNGRYKEYSYNAKGYLMSMRLADGTSITYRYDTIGRLREKILPDGRVFSYTYDVRGNLITAANPAGTVQITYDALGRVVSESFNGNAVGYRYDDESRAQTVIYPDSTLVVRRFDSRGRLVNVAANNTLLVSYEYNSLNQVTKKTFANGVVTTFQYDQFNRLVNISTGNGTIQNTVYTYDKKGNKTSVNRLNAPSLSERFSYDSRYRLVNHKRGPLDGVPATETQYSYDAVGNRQTASLNGILTNYTANNLNQLKSISGNQSIALTYDHNGNRTFDGFFYKQYDAEGRLLKDSASPSAVFTYQYDALGRRVQKSGGGAVRRYTYSGLSTVEEKDGVTQSLLNRNVFAGFLSPVLIEKDGNRFYYHQNEQNSVEAISSHNGSLTERYQYDAYGQTAIYDGAGNLRSASVAGNRFAFTGQEYDGATRSYRFHFRNYSPATGTFDQPDPMGYDDGMGLYQYVHNNPANGIDLLGLEDYSRVDGSYLRTVVEDEEVDVETYFGKDPCYHDENKIKLITQKILREETRNAISNANEAKNSVDKIGFGIGGINYYTGASWYQYGVNSDSKFYNGNLANLLGENNYYFKGKQLRSWQLNYYFTNFSLANAGFAEGSAAGNTQIWNDGKAYLSALNPFNWGKAADRLNESTIKQEMVSEAYRDFANGPDNQVPDLPAELDFNNNVGDFGAFFPVINPRTGEVTREFFVTRKIKRSQLEALKKFLKKNCPPNDDNGGTQKQRPFFLPGYTATTEVISASDPNEIIGPDGVGANKWVSVADRLPYTITYENEKSATAPAKFVKITTPVQPKMDPSTFQLGTFGFNNLTFAIPPGTASYYQRLDVRDSLEMYVDITAGYDQLTNQAFWEFQSIDPLTLLPPADPLKGFLLLQDSANRSYGHGFVNFSIKPLTNAATGDTISAIADIIFDQNAVISTNRHKNTIDALPPASQMSSSVQFLTPNIFQLTWTATDDPGGSGVATYSVYVSVNGRPYTLYRADIPERHLAFAGIKDTTYCFYVAAKDSTGNTEALKNTCEASAIVMGTALPLTWLDFTGVRRGDDALLKWITANEVRTQSFVVERSLDGVQFSAISVLGALGSTALNHYSYTDKGIAGLGVPVLYYRIKQVDNDGKFTYSKIAVIRMDKEWGEPLITAFPSPFAQTLTVQVLPAGLQDKTNTIELYTLQGTLMYRREIGRTGAVTAELTDLPAMASGVYLLRTTVNGIGYSTKVLKK